MTNEPALDKNADSDIMKIGVKVKGERKLGACNWMLRKGSFTASMVAAESTKTLIFAGSAANVRGKAGKAAQNGKSRANS